MAQPTEGPWAYGPTGSRMRDEYSQPFAIAEANMKNLIAGVFGDVRGGIEVAEANARLIAGAPRVLLALIDLVRKIDMDMHDPIFYEARAAILEATGETP